MRWCCAAVLRTILHLHMCISKSQETRGEAECPSTSVILSSSAGSPPGDPVACDGRIPVRFNTVTGWVAWWMDALCSFRRVPTAAWCSCKRGNFCCPSRLHENDVPDTQSGVALLSVRSCPTSTGKQEQHPMSSRLLFPSTGWKLAFRGLRLELYLLRGSKWKNVIGLHPANRDSRFS